MTLTESTTWATWSAAAALVIGLGVVAVDVDDWEQWRGADRLGVWHEDGIIESFPDDGLKVTWRTALRSWYAGPAVADGRVFVLDRRDDPASRTLDGTERAVALDEETGRDPRLLSAPGGRGQTQEGRVGRVHAHVVDDPQRHDAYKHPLARDASTTDHLTFKTVAIVLRS